MCLKNKLNEYYSDCKNNQLNLKPFNTEDKNLKVSVKKYFQKNHFLQKIQ